MDHHPGNLFLRSEAVLKLFTLSNLSPPCLLTVTVASFHARGKEHMMLWWSAEAECTGPRLAVSQEQSSQLSLQLPRTQPSGGGSQRSDRG